MRFKKVFERKLINYLRFMTKMGAHYNFTNYVSTYLINLGKEGVYTLFLGIGTFM